MYGSVGIFAVSTTALITSIAILITNDYITNLKTRYTLLKDWINLIGLLCEKTLKQSMINEELNDKEELELKETYNQYLDKRTDRMKKVEDVFGGILNKDSISPEQIIKLSDLSAKMM